MSHALLSPELALRLAAAPLEHVTREYPNKLDHVMKDDRDVRTPRSLHPVFYGSFDWHSCVHGWWTAFTLYRLHPDLETGPAVRRLADSLFSEEKIRGELDYLDRPESSGFERPYGWAWSLMLQAELLRHDTEEGRRWAAAHAPLAKAFAQRFKAFLPKSPYPVRAGVHTNTAFALRLAIEYAREARDAALLDLCIRKAKAWYGEDKDCRPWEPSQDEFLSPSLIEAECMRTAMSPDAFGRWFDEFLPMDADAFPPALLDPPHVTDRTDGKIAHLDGLCLSRAWCWRSLAAALPEADPRRSLALEAAERHLDAALPHIAEDYMGQHWLATFALLALTAGQGEGA
ncbi:hypothetical protein D3C72_755150 [compost metagenome]